MLENINIEALNKQLEIKETVTKYAWNDDTRKLFKRVAFDVYQSDDVQGLWKVEAAEDGKEYLVCTEENLVVEGNWKALSDSTGNSITLSYQEIPLCKFDVNEDYNKIEALQFKRKLVAKLQNPITQKQFVDTLPKYRQDILLAKYPNIKE